MNKEAQFPGSVCLWGGRDLTAEKGEREIFSLGCEEGPAVFCSLAGLRFVGLIVYNPDGRVREQLESSYKL